MSKLSHCYVAIRDLHADGGPAAPARWKRSRQTPTSWSITPPGETAIEVLRVNAVGARGLFALWGDQAQLESIATGLDEVMPAREAYRRGLLDTEPSTRNMIRAWRWWRCDVWEDDGAGPVRKDNVRRQLSVEGVLLPRLSVDPLPWDLDGDGNVVPQASAVRRVVTLHRPVILWTLAGRGSDVVLESTEDRGA